MVSKSFISDWLGNLIAFEFLILLGKNIIHHELMPVFFSFIEQNVVTEMKKRNIVVMEVVVHHTIINHELLRQFAVTSVVVELQGLHEFVLTVSVPLESFDDR
jgi:hypothetical protein